MGLFGSIFSGGGKSKSGSRLPRTSPAVAERIKNILEIRDLEMMPVQAARAFQLASDPQAKGADFVSVIESDEVISARIIRIANSVYFFRGTPANDIEKAVANIGLNELRCLLSAAMLKSLLQSRHPAREQIWGNSVATAIACRLLSRSAKQISSGEAFLCGLLHDVGKLIMIRKGGGLYDKAIGVASTERKPFVEAEEDVFELNHVEVGKWAGEQWNFPEQVIRAIAGHHNPWPNTDPASGDPITAETLVKAGDTMAHALGLGHPAHMKSFSRFMEQDLDKAYHAVGLSRADGDKFLETLEAQFDKEISLYQPENR